MQTKLEAAPASFDFMRPGTLRRRVVEYIADQGGELRSDCGQGLRRQICEALGERPTPVSQALIALEKAGMLEREMDPERHRCHAIRLVVPRPAPPPMNHQQRSELDAAQRELSDAIQRATAAAHRVEQLRWSFTRVHH